MLSASCAVHLGVQSRRISKPAGAASSTAEETTTAPRAEEYPKFDSVFEELPNDPGAATATGTAQPAAVTNANAERPRLHHIFDANLVVPEYIITFEYVRGGGSGSGADSKQQLAPPTKEQKGVVSVNSELDKIAGSFVALKSCYLDFYSQLTATAAAVSLQRKRMAYNHPQHTRTRLTSLVVAVSGCCMVFRIH